MFLLMLSVRMSKTYRIAWVCSKTETKANGEYCLSLEVAVSWIQRLRNKYPEMEHWIEYESNNIPCRVPEHLLQEERRAWHLEELVPRLLLAPQRDTSRSPQS